MNRDVKMGLAIGLLLLVGLFVWLAIVSSGKPTTVTDLPQREADRMAPATTSSREGPSAKEYFTQTPGTGPDTATIEVGPPSRTKSGPPAVAADDLTPEARRYLELLRTAPAGTSEKAPATTTAPSETIATPATYVIKQGDLLSTISQEVYGTARYWRRIAEANNITEPDRLRVGTVLKVPPLAAEDRMGIAGLTPALATGEQSHKVEEGDTLSGISQKYYGTVRQVKRIMEANTLTDENFLQVGKVLVIPKLGTTPAVGMAPVPAPVQGEHVVREGDTLTSISQQYYGTTRLYTLIMDANGIDYPEEVRPGRKLMIPPKPAGSPATPGRESTEPRLDPGEKTYVVQEGDTFTDIASREMGSSQDYLKLMKRNNISDELRLSPGQVIIIPAPRSPLRMLSTEVRER